MSIKIKRYSSNRKMYDYTLKDYVIMEDIQLYVNQGKTFMVTCDKTGQDLTKLVTLLAAAGQEKTRLKDLLCQ